MPCATLAQLSCAILGYLDLIGAGHTKDKERVRIADNLGVLVVGWALSDLRSYHSAEHMISALRQDLINVARMLRFHSKVIWIIGGDGPTYQLHILHSGASTSVRAPRVRRSGRVDWCRYGARLSEMAPFP